MKNELFDKSSAEPNLFELCRDEKRCMKDELFDKSGAEPNLFELCRDEKSASR